MEQFKVVAVSANTNSFGLYQFYLVSKAGIVYRAHANSLNVPKKDSMVDVPIVARKSNDGKTTTISYDLSKLGYELTERLPKASQEIIDEIFK